MRIWSWALMASVFVATVMVRRSVAPAPAPLTSDTAQPVHWETVGVAVAAVVTVCTSALPPSVPCATRTSLTEPLLCTLAAQPPVFSALTVSS